MSRKHFTLTVALLAGLGLAAPAYAQTAEQQQAQLEAEDARAAGAVADDAAANAQFATRVAATAAANPPQVVVPAAPRSDRPATVGNDNVTFSDHPGNSISPDYRVDFSAMDGNDDGVVVRSEARGNADLMREFHVVDLDNDGRLSRVEMKDWINPLDQ